MVYWPSETLKDRQKGTQPPKVCKKYKGARRFTIQTENVMLLSNNHAYKHDDILNVRWIYNGSIMNLQEWNILYLNYSSDTTKTPLQVMIMQSKSIVYHQQTAHKY